VRHAFVRQGPRLNSTLWAARSPLPRDISRAALLQAVLAAWEGIAQLADRIPERLGVKISDIIVNCVGGFYTDGGYVRSETGKQLVKRTEPELQWAAVLHEFTFVPGLIERKSVGSLAHFVHPARLPL